MTIWRGQALRFLMVGVASNVLLFVMYLVLTALGTGHIVAMTGLYFLGVIQTFVLNKRVTFKHGGATASSLRRYAVSYGVCYVLNLVTLIWLVDRLGYPHRLVQGVAIVTIGALLFLLQKFWVFAPSDADASVSDRQSQDA